MPPTNIKNRDLYDLSNEVANLRNELNAVKLALLNIGSLEEATPTLGNIFDGNLAGWQITQTQIKKGGILLDSENQTIYVGEDAPQAVIDGLNKLIKSSDFVSGQKGMSIDYANGNAEFSNIKARGEIKSSVFSVDEVTANAGTQGIYKSAGVLLSDVTAVASPTTFNIDIKDPDSGHAALFEAGDILRLKSAGNDSWVIISTVSDQTTFYRYICTLAHGSEATYTAGQAVVDYGQSGDGYIEQSADGTNAPYISLYKHSGSPWTDAIEIIRLGNLGDEFGLLGKDEDGNWQFKIDTNGRGIFINGNAIIDMNGITVTDLLKWVLKQDATHDTYTRIGKIGMGLPIEGVGVPAWILFYEGPPGENLIENGDAGSGDFTGWTKTTETKGAWSIDINKIPSRNWDSFKWVPNDNGDNGVLTSQRYATIAGQSYLISCNYWAIATHGTKKIEIKWYTALSGGSLISTSLVNNAQDIRESTQILSNSVTAPIGALSFAVVITSAGTAIETTYWGNISAVEIAVNQKLWLEDNGIGASDVCDNIASALSTGVYTPTLTNVNYITSSVARELKWIRIGNNVIVSGSVNIKASSTSNHLNLGISLPISSNFSETWQCAGTTKVPSSEHTIGAIYADTANDRANLDVLAATAGTFYDHYFMFMYQIL